MTGRAMMLQGTGSDVGKTVLVAALCRRASAEGLSVRPFKPQNMSNNAAVAETPLDDGTFGEIGRAQALQAQACRVPSSVDMNPVLLKPQSDVGSQVVVGGKVIGTARGREYQSLKPRLLRSVMESFERVSREADLVIVEGAGSPAEINLRAGDIANMGFACAADVPVVLVGDIDRGGVIASLVGTHAILPRDDRDLIAGYLINKFRGDVSLFDDGIEAIRRFTGWPCFGVVPWLSETKALPAEDSVMLDRAEASGAGPKIVVPVLSRIANFDDLDPLAAEPGVRLVLLREGEAFPDDASLVVLPGSKSTIADLNELHRRGWADAIRRAAARGTRVIGICGGYQMLGRHVADPDRIEGDDREAAGLGLLDIETTLVPRKVVRNVKARAQDTELTGYEIHMGRTTGPDTARAMIEIDGRPDGARDVSGRIEGCYLHGLFRSDGYRNAVLRSLGAVPTLVDFDAHVDAALDAVADRVGELIDPNLFDLARRPRRHADVVSAIDRTSQLAS